MPTNFANTPPYYSYNESIYDLLDNSTTARATREDIKRGVYVDGVTEESIHNPKDAYKVTHGYT